MFAFIQKLLGKLNNSLTALGAIVAAIAGIITYSNQVKISNVEAKLKQISLRDSNQKASEEYAKLFIKEVLPEIVANDKQNASTNNGNGKHRQAMLSVLNIVAQASSNENGQSDAKTRGMTPVTLALLLNEPGGIAEIDANYEYLDDWVAIASADNSDTTRVTAVQALAGVCQKALIQHRLDVVVRCVRAVDELLDLIPLQASSSGSAISAQSQLASFIKKEPKLLADAIVPKDSKALFGDEEVLRTEIRNALPNAQRLAQDAANQLRTQADILMNQTDAQGQLTGDAKLSLAETKATLNQVNAALLVACKVTTATLVSGRPNSGEVSLSGAAPTPQLTGSSSGPVTAQIQDLINQLKAPDTRDNAQSQLGVLGQSAVSKLIANIDITKPHKTNEDLILQVMLTLNRMPQPIVLSVDEAKQLVYSTCDDSDDVTREISKQAAAFLMNLWDDKSIGFAYSALSLNFESHIPIITGTNSIASPITRSGTSPVTGGTNSITGSNPVAISVTSSTTYDGRDVFEAALIVGTWARNLDRSIRSPNLNESMRDYAFDTAKTWRASLQNVENAPPINNQQISWKITLETLDDLVKKAETARKRPDF